MWLPSNPFLEADVFPPNPSISIQNLFTKWQGYDEDEHYVLDYEMFVRILDLQRLTT